MKMQLFILKCTGCELPDIRSQFDRHGAFSWICRVQGNNSVVSLHVSYFPKLTQHSPPAVGHRISNLFDLDPALPCSWAQSNSLLTFTLRVNRNNPNNLCLKLVLRVKKSATNPVYPVPQKYGHWQSVILWVQDRNTKITTELILSSHCQLHFNFAATFKRGEQWLYTY